MRLEPFEAVILALASIGAATFATLCWVDTASWAASFGFLLWLAFLVVISMLFDDIRTRREAARKDHA